MTTNAKPVSIAVLNRTGCFENNRKNESHVTSNERPPINGPNM